MFVVSASGPFSCDRPEFSFLGQEDERVVESL